MKDSCRPMKRKIEDVGNFSILSFVNSCKEVVHNPGT